MKYNRFYPVLILLLVALITSCSSDFDSKKIIGKWRSINNDAPNTETKLLIGDSVIVSEFYFENGVKRVFLKYSILDKRKEKLVIETINPFGIKKVDTFRFENNLLKLSTSEGKSLLLSAY